MSPKWRAPATSVHWIEKNPTQKFGALWNFLAEHHDLSIEMRERVKTYFYKGATVRKEEHIARLGVSSYGCVAAWVAHKIVVCSGA